MIAGRDHSRNTLKEAEVRTQAAPGQPTAKTMHRHPTPCRDTAGCARQRCQVQPSSRLSSPPTRTEPPVTPLTNLVQACDRTPLRRGTGWGPSSSWGCPQECSNTAQRLQTQGTKQSNLSCRGPYRYLDRRGPTKIRSPGAIDDLSHKGRHPFFFSSRHASIRTPGLESFEESR